MMISKRLILKSSAQSFNIKEKFAKLALYQEKPFFAKVKFEAAIRVWMNWVNKVRDPLHYTGCQDNISRSPPNSNCLISERPQ